MVDMVELGIRIPVAYEEKQVYVVFCGEAGEVEYTNEYTKDSEWDSVADAEDRCDVLHEMGGVSCYYEEQTIMVPLYEEDFE